MRCSCTHDHNEHAERGPKKPHSASSLSSKQLAASIRWAMYPIRNGPYTMYPTTEKAFCEHTLCTCINCECEKCQPKRKRKQIAKQKRSIKKSLKKMRTEHA